MQHQAQLSDSIIPNDQALVNVAIQYIYQNIRNNISVYDLAEYLQVSRQYVHRIFKKRTGMTVSAFVSHKKIEYAMMDIILGVEDTASAYLKYNFKSKHAFIGQIQNYMHTAPAASNLPAVTAHKK
ncbi:MULTISPECIES: helix-turn-helix domain-containing protein [Raoultella]|uniref:helix-turn-helix domain-containing protein n=1 Tax=Raoultella TaxID=160674 RepID=UPI00132FD7BE|nr:MULTISPECIES: AraC family transcriptional regulator [Raoultella]MCI1030901.1 helix-turn-helix transcriptional regulator [Raoultella terrigena]